jgi:hypothetical protein
MQARYEPFDDQAGLNLDVLQAADNLRVQVLLLIACHKKGPLGHPNYEFYPNPASADSPAARNDSRAVGARLRSPF